MDSLFWLFALFSVVTLSSGMLLEWLMWLWPECLALNYCLLMWTGGSGANWSLLILLLLLCALGMQLRSRVSLMIAMQGFLSDLRDGTILLGRREDRCWGQCGCLFLLQVGAEHCGGEQPQCPVHRQAESVLHASGILLSHILEVVEK
jgi:hypothetical protein